MAGGGTTGSSGSVSSYMSKKQVVCDCGGVAVVRTVKSGANVGKKFHGCPKWPDTECKFVKFIDEIGEMRSELEELRLNLFERDVIISQMEYQRQMNEEKIQKLEFKKDSMKEENMELKQQLRQMKVELTRATTNEKHYSVALLFTWVFVGFIQLVRKYI
ncbi:DNA topoisomerase 3-alpha [Bienertia sinuspersici]